MKNDSYSIELDEHPGTEDLHYVLESIRQYNFEVSGHGPPRPVAFFLHDRQGQIMGGVLGDLWGKSNARHSHFD